MKELIANKDYDGIRKALQQNPSLANEGIPFDNENSAKAHPLHRICDAVCAGIITDEEGAAIAKIFLEHGANINGDGFIENKDTPLVAAASLHADEVALLYIQHGAEINHGGCHGGTALHWAAWCGRYKLIQPLLEAGAEINKRCIDFTATPLFWAVHGLKFGGKENVYHQAECAKILLDAGADKNIPNIDGNKPADLLNDKEDDELKKFFDE